MRSDVGSITQTDLGYTGQRALDVGMGGLMDYHARFYDPYVNHFTQPDNVTPSGPQGLNRYSYVLNTPINANDPSGHICSGEPDECLKDNGKSGSGFTGTGGGSKGKGGNNMRDCGGKYPINCDGSPRHMITTNEETQPDYTNFDLESIGKWAENGKNLIEAFIVAENYGIPAYKQLRGLSTGAPFAEFAIGAVLQTAKDFYNPNLSFATKARNALVVGVEYGLTDIASGPAALVGGLIGADLGADVGLAVGNAPGGAAGAVVGLLAGSAAGGLAVTAFMDAAYWDPLNESLGIR